ncbi:MAG: YicC family protein [Alicyclobacillus sp. RIFOXYA1_FULL_53_8]|nr:MAG: YicC family protein [Alicyclobacillus sp. RIFOXYA1_FULL_53_8]
MGCNSMTGFGSVVKHGQRSAVRVEVRCVNHRFAEFNLRMPRELFALEEETRNVIGRYVARGRVDLFVSLESNETGERHISVDWILLDALMAVEAEAAEKYGVTRAMDESLRRALAYPGVLEQVRSVNTGSTDEQVLAAVDQACQELASMRAREGQRIAQALLHKVEVLAEVTARISARSPAVVVAYRERLRERIRELVHEFDENRWLSEVALFAERIDIDEELLRIDSHLQEARAVLQAGSPVGRRLDFLTQELHREVNTIGSKSQDSLISQAVVEAKTIIEQFREQVQNLE